MKKSHYQKRQKKRANNHFAFERSAKQIHEKFKVRGYSYTTEL